VKVKPLLSRTIDAASIGENNVIEHLEATETERAAIAAGFGLLSVTSLAAELEIRRSGAGLIVVDGVLKADVVHTCVVSLEPAHQRIDEPFRVSLAPAGSKEAPPEPKPGAEVMVDPEADQPDVVAGPTIDLGGIVIEHFSLALDPYPRAPGAKLPAEPAVGADEPVPSPFAALAELKVGKP
jgi:uncharacterized metal-binding protein YceD (DUF177 family)